MLQASLLDTPNSEPGKLLARATSLGVGGAASEFFEPRSTKELKRILVELAGDDPFVLGGGYNTLFPDGPFERPVISTSRLGRLSISGRRVTADCGVSLPRLIGKCIDAGLVGPEGFIGIPGTIGGAIAMNAGGSGREFGELVSRLEILSLETGEVLEWSGSDIPWKYRSWNLERSVVLRAHFDLGEGRSSELRRRARELIFKKSATQPLSQASAGCIFKNPPGQAAAALIDKLGLKGLRCGGAEVSGRHANFIVNRAGACSEDVTALIREIQNRVREAFDVQLETEVVMPEQKSRVKREGQRRDREPPGPCPTR